MLNELDTIMLVPDVMTNLLSPDPRAHCLWDGGHFALKLLLQSPNMPHSHTRHTCVEFWWLHVRNENIKDSLYGHNVKDWTLIITKHGITTSDFCRPHLKLFDTDGKAIESRRQFIILSIDSEVLGCKPLSKFLLSLQ